MEADKKNIAHKARNDKKGKENFSFLSFVCTGMRKTGLSGLLFLFLFSAGQLTAQSTQIYSTKGTYTFTVPTGVTSMDIQAWGGGGCGGRNTSGRARGGGGGGAYTGGTIHVTPGATLTVVVGAGGIYNDFATSTDDGGESRAGAIIANGGSRGVIGDDIVTNGGAGGTSSTDPGGVISFVSYAGGNGGNGYVAWNNGGGGGGGESASPTGIGHPGDHGTLTWAGGIGGAGGTGNAGGGDGGRGSNNGWNSSTDGTSPGGGAGGRADNNGTNRNGGDGQVIITWTIPPPCVTPVSYNMTGGGNYCSGGTGSTVGLSSSETGVSYQLFLAATPQGSPLAGTGTALSFGNQVPAGTYTVVATRTTDGCTATMTGNAAISITPIPTQPSAITGSLSPCIGYSQIYSVINVAGVTYNWTFPTDWTQTGGGTSNSVTITTGSNSGNIIVTPSDACGSGTARALAVTTTTSSILAQPGTITGPATPCVGSTLLNYSVPNVAGITYTWTFPASWTITAGQGSNSVTVTAGAAVGNVKVTPSNACGNGQDQTRALSPVSSPSQPGLITGNITPCQGSTETYRVTNVPGVTYSWNFPSGWTQSAGGTTNSITVDIGNGSGNITVTPSNASCNGSARNLAVAVSPAAPATPGTITGTAMQCPNITGQTYSIAAVPNATAYTWNVPTGWAITAGAGTTSITVATGTSGQNGNISVTAANPCGTSAAQSLAVTAIPIPSPSISADYCTTPGHITLTAHPNGLTYLWNTGANTQSITVDESAIYSVTVPCAATVYLAVGTEFVVDGSFTNFDAKSPRFFTEYDQNQNYYAGGETGLQPEGRYAVNTNAWYNNSASLNGYHTNFHGRDHTNNTVGPRNFMLVNGSDIKIGTPSHLRIIWQQNITIAPNTEYYFSAWGMNLNPGSPAELQFEIVTTQNGTQQVGSIADLNVAPKPTNEAGVALSNWVRFYSEPFWTSPSGATKATIRIINNNTEASGNDFGLDDISFGTLAPLPATITPTTNGSVFCIGQTLNLFANLEGGKPPYTFTWTGPAGSGFSSTEQNPSISNVTAINTGTYTLSVTDGYGCPAVTASTSPAKINPFPTCSITGPATICPSSTGNNYTGPAGMTNYAWSITGNGTIGGTNGSNVSINAGSACNGSFTLSLEITDGNGCSSNCQQVMAVQDVTAPTFTRPNDLTIFTDANCHYNATTGVTGDVTNEADFCSASLNATFTDVTTVVNPCVTEIKRTWSLVDNCGNAASNQVQTITITDHTPPVLSDPTAKSFCVEDIHQANFVEITTDITPIRPDWYIMEQGSTELDLDPAIFFTDNCTSKTDLVLHWRIDFAATTPAPALPFITGTGQPSKYNSSITFLGDAVTLNDVTHTITYWITDQCGNASPAKVAAIVVKPRPNIIKQTP